MIMAERRMLAKSIIESDAFMDMPAETQMLYIHLNMAADDDGFVANPRTIMRSCGSSNDSMKMLISKKFVLTFEKNDNFLVVIKHWRIHNYIRSDRYKASTYKEFMRDLYYDENKAYTDSPDGHTPCLQSGTGTETDGSQTVSVPSPVGIPDGSQTVYQTGDNPETQVRLGKDSIDKAIVSTGEDSTGKGECERGNPPPPAAITDPDKKRERIDFFIGRLQFFETQGWNGECWYTMAAAEGITKGEIDLRKIQLEKQKEAGKK